ncbi:MAG TPA: lactate racemase domain-containing protein [Pirellulales bacterium]|nr:lactate racemase domain-containing protein [Pirellulales bacterium]
MTCIIPYGIDSSVDLGLAPPALLGVSDLPRGEPLADPAAELAAALAGPLGFPPLAKAIVPGDRIVVAWDSSAPQAGVLLAALVEYLIESGADAGNLTVLGTQTDSDADSEDPRDCLPETWREQVALEIHDPAAKAQLGLLGSSHEGRPIYLNRTLLDADLVVPLGCLRAGETLGYHGRHGGLFPAFADQKTLERYRKPRSGAARHEVDQRHRQEIDEIGWLLGTQFTVQVVPGAGDSLLAVLAGHPTEVFEQGQRLFEAAWSVRLARKASLVVAAVSGRAGLQTWENLARALASAGRAVAEGGAIALCTELEAAPGPAVAGLGQTDDWPAVLRRIRRDCPADALVAAEFIEICGRARVYLLSRLEETTVEELGLAPVASVSDLKRLAGRHESCIVLANAQYVRVTIDEDQPADA